MLSPPSIELDGLPRLIPFKYAKTEDQVFTHRSYFARPTAVFEDPPSDPAPDNEVLEYVGDSVLSLAVATLTKKTYRTYPCLIFPTLRHPHHTPTTAGLRVGPHAVSHALSLSLYNQPLNCLNTSRKYGHLLFRMLRLRKFPSFMAFPSVCAPTSPSWPAYSVLYMCKVGLCFFRWLLID